MRDVMWGRWYGFLVYPWRANAFCCALSLWREGVEEMEGRDTEKGRERREREKERGGVKGTEEEEGRGEKEEERELLSYWMAR